MSDGPRVGVFGLKRGLRLAQAARAAGFEVAVVCDQDEETRTRAGSELDVPSVVTWAELLEHDVDAVVLANHFDEHAPFAIEAMNDGVHVLSETIACATPAQGAGLIEAAERSGCIYAFGENYPFKDHALTLARLYRDGDLGEFQYGEAEYTHGWADPSLAAFQGPATHWRRRVVSLAYSTHAIAPMMTVTGLWPVEVTGHVVPRGSQSEDLESARRGFGRAGLMTLRMSNGALVKILVGFVQGELAPDASWIRVHGSDALAENLRSGDSRIVRVVREPWTSSQGQRDEAHVAPRDPGPGPDWGIDNERMMHDFAAAVRERTAPLMDVRRGVAASLTALYAIRSHALGSVPLAIPDVRSDDVMTELAGDDDTSVEGHRGGDATTG